MKIALDQKTPDGIRRIFEGGLVIFDHHETKAIADFKNYCMKHHYTLEPM